MGGGGFGSKYRKGDKISKDARGPLRLESYSDSVGVCPESYNLVTGLS